LVQHFKLLKFYTPDRKNEIKIVGPNDGNNGLKDRQKLIY